MFRTATVALCLSLLGCGSSPAPRASGKTQSTRGFFNFEYDAKKDRLLLEIERFDEEFLYAHFLSAGVGSNDIGLDRGQLGGTRIVRFERRGPRVLLVQPNTAYRADSDNPDEVTAVRQAFARSILWGFDIEEERGGSVVVDAGDFLLRDVHGVAARLKSRGQGTYKLDRTRSAFYLERTRSFPRNSEFEVTLTFTGTPAGPEIRSVTPSPEAVTVRQRHSFIRLPDPGYEPRAFDPRCGYFRVTYADYAAPIGEPIAKRLIARHRLEKKNPGAAVSEAVKPIVYYLDRGTPEPVRSALLDGARWWAQAFEAAGYRNAFRVEMMPEGADSLDVRTNVIQWVHRSTRGWSYGRSIRDPRTGEILKGHVTLGSLRVRQDYLIAEGLLSPYRGGRVPREMQEMALARIRQLSAHEVGHTLGLSHSYTSSMEDRASVMDYPHPLAKLNDRGEIDLSDAYDDKIGAWDKVAILYGYQDFPEGTDEKAALSKILSNARARGLTFLSDQDARPQGSSHPRAHLWDNGTDAAAELDRVLLVRAKALSRFSQNNIRPGAPLSTLEEVLVPIYFFHRYQTEAAVKTVGGLHYTYAHRGDGQTATKLISPARQHQALGALLRALHPDILGLPEPLIRLIPPRALGYSRNRELLKIRTELTFDPLGAAEAAAGHTVGLLLHPARASRLVELKSRDAAQPGLASVLGRLIEATWRSAREKGYRGEVQRVVDHVVLTRLMKLASDGRAAGHVRAIASDSLDRLDSWCRNQKPDDADLSAHYRYASAQIARFRRDPSFVGDLDVLKPPAGSPIGSACFGSGP